MNSHTSRLRLILAIILLLLVLASLLEFIFAPELLRSSVAAMHYKAGRFNRSTGIYQRLREQNAKDRIAAHNEAKSLYKEGKFPEANSALQSIEPDRKGDHGLNYDLGNTSFKQNDFKTALKHFKQAILQNPEDYDAKANYELTLRKLKEEQPKPQPQPQPQDQPEQKKDDKADYNNILGALDQRETLDRQQDRAPRQRKPRNWW